MTRTFSGGTGTLNNETQLSKSPRFVFRAPRTMKLPNLWSGAASIVTPFKQTKFVQFRRYPTTIPTLHAMSKDWEAIGGDMEKAMKNFSYKHPNSLPVQGKLFDPEETKNIS